MNKQQPVQMQEAQLREFVANGAVTGIDAVGKVDGFELHVVIGTAAGVLGNARGVVRTFSSLNTLASFVKRLGAGEFNVVIGQFGATESLQDKNSRDPQ